MLVQVLWATPSEYDELIDYGFTPLQVNDKDLLIYASSDDLRWLDNHDFHYRSVSRKLSEELFKQDDSFSLRQFHTYATMTDELQDIASTYPGITVLYDLGDSVLGRTIWGLKITDNPGVEENEPEVRICGAHHGNEYMSVELPLLMAWYLVENYAFDPYVADLVDNRENWIIPMVNPDGREAGSRYNANGIDLNRDYGYMWGVYGDCYTQPETRVMRENALDNNYVLSLSFHCSGDIVNYVWNYKGEAVADSDVVVMLSEQYGSHNGYWVVEGYDWYQTRGDTNDFSYGCRGDIDWTIEVQNYNIPEAWDLNREAMLEIIEAANMGLTGVVTDAITGDPLNATLWVDEVWWPCFTDPKLGDYHKPLLPGAYTVHFRANGYDEQVHTIEVVDSPDPTVFDIALYPSDEYYAYQVTSCNFYDPYSWPNNFQNNPTEAVDALGPPDDLCASLGRGGVIVLDMGERINNAESAIDFRIYEGDGSDDGYHVRVSQEWNGPWFSVGSGFGTTEFDLEDGPIDWARYIEIRDDSDGSAYEQNPCVDIDAIQNLAPDHFILNLVDFPMYLAEEPFSEMCGPAVAQMTLNYIWWNSTQYPSGPPMTFDDQTWLYDRGRENNSNPDLPYFDLRGMWSVIQSFKPQPYSEYGYNFNKHHHTDQTTALKQICQWINYTIGTYGGHAEGHPYHVPSAVPAYGDYTNWMAIRGIRTDTYAYPLPDELTIHGFWINDPLPSGIGENTYKDINNFIVDYYHAMTTGEYIGEYLAVLEPPGSIDHCTLHLAPPSPRFTPYQQFILAFLRSQDHASNPFEIFTDHWVIQAALQGMRDQLLPYDDHVASLLEQTVPGTPLFITSQYGNDYYAVPFVFASDNPDDDQTMIVVLVDADDGHFKEASWINKPVRYLRISREEAQLLAYTFAVEKLGLQIDDIALLHPTLMYRQSSLYHPDWQILIENYGIYVSQEGILSYIIFR